MLNFKDNESYSFRINGDTTCTPKALHLAQWNHRIFRSFKGEFLFDF